MSSTSPKLSAPTLSAQPAGGALYAIAVLFLTNVTNYLDRAILTLVVQPVKAALHLSDGEIGLIQGLAFVLTFVTAGLFMGGLIDRRNRRNLLFVSVVIWSASAAACGFAAAGWQLFLGRMGIGVGEATLIPAAVSLISDLFSPARRGGAYGFFITGSYAGTGASLILVGVALPALQALSHMLAETHGVVIAPWRMVMFSMVLPGALCCLLLAFMREPARRPEETLEEGVSVTGVREWFSKWRVLLPHHMFSALVALAIYGINSWMPTVLIREHHLQPRAAGLTYGLMVTIVGIASALSAGYLADFARRRGGAVGRAVFALGVTVVGLVGFTIIGFAHSVPAIIVGSILVLSPLSISQVVTVLLISDVVSGQSRGQITSIYFVFAGLIGTAGGPAAVGYVSDYLSSRGGLLSHALVGVGIAGVLAALGFGVVTLIQLRSGGGARGARVLTPQASITAAP